MMVLPRVVVLAAGQGSRMGNLTQGLPKCLLPVVGGEPLLARTVRQLRERHFHDITVVIGYRQQMVRSALTHACGTLKFVENAGYAADTNIGSLLLGLGSSDAPVLILEGDIAFSGDGIGLLATAAGQKASAWFTYGHFQPHQLGGILQSDERGKVIDLRYVDAYAERFASYKKLIGALYVGNGEMAAFHQLLLAAAAETTAQYYLTPWVKNLRDLPCIEQDMIGSIVATFNTAKDYERCVKLFQGAASR
jgi:NDP-sugar pyrophosphorylase family protein